MTAAETTRTVPTPIADKVVDPSVGPSVDPGSAGAAPPPGTARPGLLLGLILTGQFMAVLDVFIVNVAAPVIRTDLHTSGSALQLVIAGYTVAYAVLLITGARLGERHGFSRVFQFGVAGFTLASLACGLAPTAGALIGFRVLQGVGAALMVPQVMSLIQRTFSGAARLRALGAYTAVLAGAGVVGQVLGGVLVGADLFGSGWRPVFLVNVPIGSCCCWPGASCSRSCQATVSAVLTCSAWSCSPRRSDCWWCRWCSATRSTGRSGAG